MAETEAAAAERNRKLVKMMERVANHRDERALGELFDHFVPLLRAYSLSQQPGAMLVADELAQEVMIRVWEKAHTYDPKKAAVSTWIFTLARNYRIDQIRKNARFVSDIDPESIWQDMSMPEDENPFEAAQRTRAEEKIHEGLMQLPHEQRQVLARVYLQGKSHSEAAAELGLPLGTVKSRVRLALQKMELLVER